MQNEDEVYAQSLEALYEMLTHHNLFRIVNQDQSGRYKKLCHRTRMSLLFKSNPWAFTVIFDEYNQPKLEKEQLVMVKTEKGYEFWKINELFVQIKKVNYKDTFISFFGIFPCKNSTSLVGYMMHCAYDYDFQGSLSTQRSESKNLDYKHAFHLEYHNSVALSQKIYTNIQVEGEGLGYDKKDYFIDGHNRYFLIYAWQKRFVWSENGSIELWLRKARKSGRKFQLTKSTIGTFIIVYSKNIHTQMKMCLKFLPQNIRCELSQMNISYHRLIEYTTDDEEMAQRKRLQDEQIAERKRLHDIQFESYHKELEEMLKECDQEILDARSSWQASAKELNELNSQQNQKPIGE